MERIITYHITQKDDGLRIKSFLSAKGYSSQNLTDLKKRPESVLLNGEPAFVIKPLHLGDVLTIHIMEDTSSERIPPVKQPLHIVYEDEDILVVNKPAGMPIHPSLNNYENSLANGLAYYYKEQGKPFIFRCINRLDRDTSGLTVIAKHMVSASILAQMTARRELHREYLAIVKGLAEPSQGTIDAPLGRKDSSMIERMIDWEKGERAITHYQLKEYKNGHSLLSIHLETGRTHQIRIHMKYLGYPLIGDYLYNPDMEHITRQALHSCRLTFSHPITGQHMDFTAPLPEDMQKVLYSI